MIRNARLPDGSRHDIEIKDGRIAALRPPTASEPGVLLLPPLVDGHIHLDKTLLGLPWVPNQAAGNTVADRIAAERKVRSARTVSETIATRTASASASAAPTSPLAASIRRLTRPNRSTS